MALSTDTHGLSTALNYARTRAHLDAPDTICQACVTATPLANERPGDVHTIFYLRRLAAEVDAATLTRLGGEMVNTEIRAAYADAFWQFCADPVDCTICTDPDEGPCGHEKRGEPCPAEQ